MPANVPETMPAVIVEAPGGALRVAMLPVPRPGPGEVLVRMAAAPVHPADLGVIDGRYAERSAFPLVPGAEGSGVVVAAGPGTLARLLVGRRVACAASPPHGGTWAAYVATSASRCVPLHRDVDLERGATLLVNPLSALAMLEIARQGRHRAIVNAAAAAALGRMITRRAVRTGRDVIAVVRREDQLESVLADGARHALVSEGDDFVERLRPIAHELRATLVLDPVGGSLTQRLLAASPERTTVLVYGALDEEPMTVDPRSLLYGHRRLEGFFLPVWASTKGLLARARITARAQRLLASDLATHIRERVPLDGAAGAVVRYRSAMSGGKVLLVMAGPAAPSRGDVDAPVDVAGDR